MAGGRSRRDLIRERFWREQVQGQAASGLSVGAYCRRHRLRPSAFYYWRRVLGQRDACKPSSDARGDANRPSGRAGRRTGGSLDSAAGQGRPAGTAFVPVTVAEETGSGRGVVPTPPDEGRRSHIEILLANGRRVQVTGPVDRQALAAVLGVAEGIPC